MTSKFGNELREFRGKITVETHLALKAQSIARDVEISEIAREVLHAWATKRIDEATVLKRLLQNEGMSGQGEVMTGTGSK